MKTLGFKSLAFCKTKTEAFNHWNLTPRECIDILQKHYQDRMERMKPNTICDMVMLLMMTATGCDYEEEIEDLVQEYCNSF